MGANTIKFITLNEIKNLRAYTVGGDLIEYPGELTTRTYDIFTSKTYVTAAYPHW